MALQDDVQAIPPCHSRACAIQKCLTKNGYDEARCQSAIAALYECCEAFYRDKGDKAKSPSCPQPELLKLRLSRIRSAGVKN